MLLVSSEKINVNKSAMNQLESARGKNLKESLQNGIFSRFQVGAVARAGYSRGPSFPRA